MTAPKFHIPLKLLDEEDQVLAEKDAVCVGPPT